MALVRAIERWHRSSAVTDAPRTTLSVVETPVVETPVVETLWTTTVVVSAAWASIMRRLAQTTPEEREEFARQAAREASESLPRCSSPTRRQ